MEWIPETLFPSQVILGSKCLKAAGLEELMLSLKLSNSVLRGWTAYKVKVHWVSRPLGAVLEWCRCGGRETK